MELTEENVQEVLNAFRPQLQADGGDLEYISLDSEKRVHVRLVGACGSCPMATMTLRMGVEQYLKDAIPDVAEVVQDM